MVESDDNASPIRILGFITFKASSFLMDDGEGHELGEGAFEISELAVSSECERRGVGTDLVKYATVLATELNEEKLGIRYVVLCADPAAEDFYSKPALGLHRIGDFYRIPNEHWNTNCIPMVVKLFN
nr:GNAT family N-acetyltransferase [Caproicibacter fermentans]